MPFDLLDTGLIRVSVRYVRILKPGAPYSYYRRIPEPLRAHYQGKTFIRVSLKTRDIAEATTKAAKLAAGDDALWATLRSQEGRAARLTTPANRDAAKALLGILKLSPGALGSSGSQEDSDEATEALDTYFFGRYGHAYLAARNDSRVSNRQLESMFEPDEVEMLRLLKEGPNKRQCLLSEARDEYLKEHRNPSEKLISDTNRAIDFVISVVGDFPLAHYSRDHAKKVRDAFLKRGNKTTTVLRRLNSIRAVFNKGKAEFNLSGIANPFEKLPIPRLSDDAELREPFTAEELRVIAQACRAKDDDIRHIIAMQSDTGARLGEIVGLRIEDVLLDREVPHIRIRPHRKHGRRLKTDVSERDVPLVGESLWGAQRAMEATKRAGGASGWLFPRYASDAEVKATHADNTVNKWLKKTTETAKTSHCFRHAMRDRLRHSGVPDKMQDVIGGWGSRSEGEKYGSGYLLKQLQAEMDKVV